MSGKENKSSFLIIIFILSLGGILFYASTFSKELSFNSPVRILKQKQEVSLVIFGDMMLDRNVRNRINSLGFEDFFSGVRELVRGADMAVVNLEGPFTIYPSVTAYSKNAELKFTFDPDLVPKIADIGFDILGLANNHILNFGHEGLSMTKEYIKNNGMLYYGDPSNRDEISIVIEKNGISLAFIGFHEFSYINYNKIIAEIDRLRPEVDVIIVTPHWGIEYKKEPTPKMQELAHEYIDHGADMVIGTHPHVVGDIEEYNGKKIFYSLGNFVFDQYFSEETMKGLGVSIEIEKDKDIYFNYRLIPTRVDRNGVYVVADTKL